MEFLNYTQPNENWLFFFLRCYEKGCIALDEINFVELRFALAPHRLTNPLRGLRRMGTPHGFY